MSERLQCVSCYLGDPKKVAPAKFIYMGYGVCEKHLKEQRHQEKEYNDRWVERFSIGYV